MLCYNDIIKPTVLYALNKYPDIFSFTITTNGTLLTEESLLFFYEHNFSNIMLSIDGDKDSQDYNRPYHDGTGSFDIIQKKIPMILKYFPNTSFRSTITPYSVKNLFNNYLFAEKNNFSQIVFMPELRHNWDSKDLNIFSYELQKIFNYRLNQYRNNCMPIQSKQINYALEDILNHDFKIMTNNNNNNNNNLININLDKWISRCGTGVESCAIGFDGSIYTCIERPSRDYKEQGFYLGTLKNGIDKNTHIQILKKIIKDYNKIFSAFKSCSDNCISYQRCLFTHCISNSIDNFNNTNTIPLSLCYVNLEILKNCICNMQILFKENNLLFEHYLLQNTNTYKQIYYIKNIAKEMN